jgi:hypothetical protein
MALPSISLGRLPPLSSHVIAGRTTPVVRDELFELAHRCDRMADRAASQPRNRHFISKVVNRIPPLTSAIQAKLFEFKASQRFQPS